MTHPPPGSIVKVSLGWFASRVGVDGNSVLEGDLLWADAHFLRIRNGKAESIVPKSQVLRIEARDGTEYTNRADVLPDRWGSRPPGTI